jgi:hypothetical protein
MVGMRMREQNGIERRERVECDTGIAHPLQKPTQRAIPVRIGENPDGSNLDKQRSMPYICDPNSLLRT